MLSPRLSVEIIMVLFSIFGRKGKDKNKIADLSADPFTDDVNELIDKIAAKKITPTKILKECSAILKKHSAVDFFNESPRSYISLISIQYEYKGISIFDYVEKLKEFADTQSMSMLINDEHKATIIDSCSTILMAYDAAIKAICTERGIGIKDKDGFVPATIGTKYTSYDPDGMQAPTELILTLDQVFNDSNGISKSLGVKDNADFLTMYIVTYARLMKLYPENKLRNSYLDAVLARDIEHKDNGPITKEAIAIANAFSPQKSDKTLKQ